jgi:hypothetical protein
MLRVYVLAEVPRLLVFEPYDSPTLGASRGESKSSMSMMIGKASVGLRGKQVEYVHGDRKSLGWVEG